MTCSHFGKDRLCPLLLDASRNRNVGNNGPLLTKLDIASIALGSEEGECPRPIIAKSIKPILVNEKELCGCPVGLLIELSESHQIPESWGSWIIPSFYKLMMYSKEISPQTAEIYIRNLK